MLAELRIVPGENSLMSESSSKGRGADRETCGMGANKGAVCGHARSLVAVANNDRSNGRAASCSIKMEFVDVTEQLKSGQSTKSLPPVTTPKRC